MTKVLLNNIDHQDLRLIMRGSRAGGDAVNQVLVFPTELEQAQRDFPIVLRPDADGRLRPVALLGLERCDNLFLGDDGAWQSGHVPAVLQGGPFAIAAPAGGEGGLQILIDPEHPRLSRHEGEPLFLEHGGHAPVLEKMLGVLRGAYIGNALLDPMVEAFRAAGLLQPFALELQVGPGRAYAISDAQTIDRERLATLTGEELAALHRGGFLQSAFMMAASLGNLQGLVNRMAARLAAAQDAAA
jgi:hypothetical protein